MVEKHRYSLIVLTGVETIVENSVRCAHSGPSQRFLRGLPTTCLCPAPLPVRVLGGHASTIISLPSGQTENKCAF